MEWLPNAVSIRGWFLRKGQEQVGIGRPAPRCAGVRVGSRVDIGYCRRLLKDSRCPRAGVSLAPARLRGELGGRILWIREALPLVPY